MRRTPVAIASLILALVVGVWFLSYIVNGLYLNERRTLVQRIAASKTDLERIQKAKADQRNVNGQIQGYIDRTLGGNWEEVDHKFRARLSRIAEHIQLQNLVVNTIGSGKKAESPAKTVFRGAQRALGDEPDFFEIEGSIGGVGTLEQVLTLIDAIEAEPWIKRIDELRLDPSDNGAKVRVDIRLTTLFLPNGTPKVNGGTTVSAPRTERFASLVSNNPFRVPPPNTAPPPEDKPAAPGEFQYGQWQMTGIAQTAMGPEVWLRNAQAKQSKYLNVGDKLHEMVFVHTDGQSAEFQLGLERYIIEVGKNLNDRKPVNH